MDYAHHFTIKTTDPGYAAAWPHIIADTAYILSAVTRLGVILTGPDNRGVPILDPSQQIAFGGGTAADPLQLPAPPWHPAPVSVEDLPITGTCRTRQHPYDLAVAAVLLRSHMLIGGDVIAISSTGRWTDEWLYGLRPGQPGARMLLRILFGGEPAVNPIRAHRSDRPLHGGGA